MPSLMCSNSDYDSARCTSAAPSYFSPHILQNSQLGSYQDGGLRHNNPVNIAQWEAGIIWPQSTVMDMVLSMGTGTSPSTVSSTCGWRGRCLARLYRCFMSLMDGQSAWQELQNYLPDEKKANYFRLNVVFDGQEPALDDLQEMRLLKEHGNRIKNENELEIAESLVAKQFYFELESAPCLIGGRYQCRGYLRCRFSDKQQTTLLNYILSRSGAFTLGDREIAILQRPLMFPNGDFRHDLQFLVNSLDEEFAIFLTGINMKSRVISGFPTTATSLMRNQGLDNPFGNRSRRVHHPETTTQNAIKRRRTKVQE